VFAVDAVGDARLGWLGLAIALHVSGQLARGLAWRGVLGAAWPRVARTRACAWYVCGAGLTGVLSARGGDLVRVALARRKLPDASWPALGGTLAAESSFESACGLVLTVVAAGLGARAAFGAPSPLLLVGAVVALVAVAALAYRSPRVRRVVSELLHGLAVFRRPRSWLREVLPWQVSGRLLRLTAMCCFLAAFGLPVTPAVVVAACAAQGSSGSLPVPGAGPAAMGAALLVAVPMAAGHPVDPHAVHSLALVVPMALTAVGVGLSVVLLSVLTGVRTPRALWRAQAALGAAAVGGRSPAAAMRSGSAAIR
jgi:Lysylphosphatidylglycerol synthase TM region